MGTRLKIKKMAASLWGENMTLNHDISRTSWRMKVSDGSFFWIFHSLSFEPNLYWTRNSPLKVSEQTAFLKTAASITWKKISMCVVQTFIILLYHRKFMLSTWRRQPIQALGSRLAWIYQVTVSIILCLRLRYVLWILMLIKLPITSHNLTNASSLQSKNFVFNAPLQLPLIQTKRT